MDKYVNCHYCSAASEVRPYGPRGEMICFACAMATPERKRQTERAFMAQIDACGDVSVIDGTKVGPYPIKHAALGGEVE